jgi:hypothetical protein
MVQSKTRKKKKEVKVSGWVWVGRPARMVWKGRGISSPWSRIHLSVTVVGAKGK